MNIIDEDIKSIMIEMDSIIMTIPGIGLINGAMILGEIGDVSRFSNPSKLLAYAGLDPTVNQSGKFTAKSTKMSKRGSTFLRYALINAAWNVSLNNKTFDDYYIVFILIIICRGCNNYIFCIPICSITVSGCS